MCSFCERLCTEPFYCCNDRCQFYIHESCLDLLPINCRLLSRSLALLTIPSFECTTCKRLCSGLTFYCRVCKCKFCAKCVLWPEKNVLGVNGRFFGAPHWHRLGHFKTRIGDKRRTCFLYKENCIAGTWSYKCSGCHLVFHKLCADLPAQLEHPSHLQHPLTLLKRSSSGESMTYHLCLKGLSKNFPLFHWVYQCQESNFQLDTQCVASLPSLEYKEHPNHLLYIVVNMHGNINCQACGRSCKGSCAIRCAHQRCGFSLHLQCGILPSTVKHAFHVHPLVLKDYCVDDNDSDEFACHICEEERDPRLRVYCCLLSCLMISDVKCVLHEVLSLLRGEHGDVDLRTPFPQVSYKVINNKSIFAKSKLDSTSEEDVHGDEMIEHVFSYEKLLSSLEGQLRIESQEDDGAREEIGVESYPFSWKALSCFSKLLRVPSINVHKLPFIRQYNGSITTRDDTLPKILGPIYQEFFAMYNIFYHEYNLRLAEKRALIFIMCCILHQMRMIKVIDVSKDIILVWLGLIRFVQEKERFNVEFVAKNMKHVFGKLITTFN